MTAFVVRVVERDIYIYIYIHSQLFMCTHT